MHLVLVAIEEETNNGKIHLPNVGKSIAIEKEFKT